MFAQTQGDSGYMLNQKGTDSGNMATKDTQIMDTWALKKNKKWWIHGYMDTWLLKRDSLSQN